MNGSHKVTPRWRRWAAAALLAATSVPLLFLLVLRGGDAITWASTLAADGALALAVLVVMQDACRRTFLWMAALALPLFLVAVVLHNVEYAITGLEEPTFILTAILGVPAMLLAGVGGLVWVPVRDRLTRRSGRASTAQPA